MKYNIYLEDYKGKHKILTDYNISDLSGYENSPKELDLETFDYFPYMSDCIYYGVPYYIGDIKEIHEFFDEKEKEDRIKELFYN